MGRNKYDMIRMGNLSAHSELFQGDYYESYERKTSKYMNPFKIQKIEIHIHRSTSIFAFNITFHNPSTELISNLSKYSYFSYEKHCHDNSPLVTLKIGLLPGIKIEDFNPEYIVTLLDRLQRVEMIGYKTKFLILKGLSHHTQKIIITNEMVKIGDLSCLAKDFDFINTFTFREQYERMKNITSSNIKKINVCITIDGFVCISVTATDEDSFLSMKNSKSFNRESLDKNNKFLSWYETTDNLNKNPKILMNFIDYLCSIENFSDETKQEILKGFSRHIKNLTIHDNQNENKEEVKESLITLNPAKKSMTPQFNTQGNNIPSKNSLPKKLMDPFISKPPEKDEWHTVSSDRSKGKKRR